MVFCFSRANRKYERNVIGIHFRSKILTIPLEFVGSRHLIIRKRQKNEETNICATVDAFSMCIHVQLFNLSNSSGASTIVEQKSAENLAETAFPS